MTGSPIACLLFGIDTDTVFDMGVICTDATAYREETIDQQ
jgi:hypothetical protein